MYRNVVNEMSPDRNVPWPDWPDRKVLFRKKVAVKLP